MGGSQEKKEEPRVSEEVRGIGMEADEIHGQGPQSGFLIQDGVLKGPLRQEEILVVPAEARSIEKGAFRAMR